VHNIIKQTALIVILFFSHKTIEGSSFDDLPNECIDHIFRSLDPSSFVAASRACKRFYTIASNEALKAHILTNALLKQNNNNAQAALADAVKKNIPWAIPLLIRQHNADVNKHTHVGNSYLMKALSLGHSDIIKKLLANGFDTTIGGQGGNAFVRYATTNNDIPLLTILLSHQNIHINAADEKGNTPLMEVAGISDNNINMIHFLLDNGANKTLKNAKGKTAYQQAQERKAYCERIGQTKNAQRIAAKMALFR
jgi:hypothetical protein